MSNQLGVNQIGEFQFNDIYAGDFPRVGVSITAGANDLVRGSAVSLSSAGAAELVQANDTIFGIVDEDIPAGGTGVANITGQFIGPRLTFGAGNWTDFVTGGVKVNDSLFFFNASLSH